MAKKSSMPDFTFALGADLREAAAKMRKMSQPPKHQSAQQSDEAVDAMSEDAEVTVESSAVEPPIAKKETLTPEPSSDATIGVDVSPTCPRRGSKNSCTSSEVPGSSNRSVSV